MARWRHEDDYDPEDPLRVSRWVLCVLWLTLLAAWILVAGLCTMGCSSAPPSCPDHGQGACGHRVRVELVELRCVDCDAYLGGSQVTRWDQRAR